MAGRDEYYSRCPHDGCLEVDRRFKNGGVDGKGQEHLNWSMYHADPKAGGCGYNWAPTTKQGTAQRAAKGLDSRWKTPAAQADAVWDHPSDRFRRNYEAIQFGYSREELRAAIEGR